jgi:molybdenum cofactor biosynthesis enzyme MoaA
MSWRAEALRPRELLGKRGSLEDVLAGIFATEKIGMTSIKLNGFISQCADYDEILELVELARDSAFEMRFMEHERWKRQHVWSPEKTVHPKRHLRIRTRQVPVKEDWSENGSAPRPMNFWTEPAIGIASRTL